MGGVIFVQFTKEQRDMINRLENGVIEHGLSDREKEILIYLQTLEIATPRVDFRDGLWRLTQKGESVLQELRSREEQAEKYRKQEADRKAEKHNERIFQVFLALFSAVAGAVLGNLDRLGV